MFLARKGIYRSNGPTPSLVEALDASKFAILLLLGSRADKNKSMDFMLERADRAQDLMRQIFTWLEQPGNNATMLVGSGIIRPTTWAPEASESLAMASAFYWEAKALQHIGDIERSWAALLQCHFYIGQASGPESLREQSSRGGSKQAEPFEPFQREVLKWLAELDGQSYESVAAVVRQILPKAKQYWADRVPPAPLHNQVANARPDGESSRRRSTNPELLITRWTTKKEQIREAVVRLLVDGKPMPGRKKKTPSDPANALSRRGADGRRTSSTKEKKRT